MVLSKCSGVVVFSTAPFLSLDGDFHSGPSLSPGTATAYHFLNQLLSVSDGRFPRARLQSPRRYASAGLSARAFPLSRHLTLQPTDLSLLGTKKDF